MNAYEYGLKYFNVKYQPKQNCVIFNDKNKIVGEDDSHLQENYIPSPYTYVQVLFLSDGHYTRQGIDSPKRLNYDTVRDYLIPNNYVSATSDNTLEGYPNNYLYEILTYKGEYYVKVGSEEIQQLDEIVLKVKKSKIVTPKLFGLSEQKLKSIIDDESTSLVFFFTEDGAVLENAYASITDVQPNEIIFFLEKDSLINPFSVTRVKSGRNIKTGKRIPYSSIASLAQFFNVKIKEKNVENIFKNHFKSKKEEESDGIFTFIMEIDNYILEIVGDGLKLLIGDPLVYIGDSISTGLKADPKRWQYYADDGSVNKDFDPIFPGLKQFLEKEEEKEKASQGQDLNSNLTTIRTTITNAINKIPNESYRIFLKDKLEFVFQITDELERLYNSFKKLISFKTAFIYFNALLIGIYNSLIEAIGGIISLVGHIVNIPSYLAEAKKKVDIGTVFRIGAEMLENAFESFLYLFSFKNIKALFKGLYDVGKLLVGFLSSPETMVSKLADGVNYIAIKADLIGYGIGYVIGFIIEEVLTAIATGGAKTVAQAFKLTLDAFASALKTGKKAVKIAKRTSADFINALSTLFKKIKNMDVAKLMDKLIAWVKQLVKTSKELAEEAFEKLFKNNLAKIRIKRLKYTPTKIDGNVITLCPL